MYNRGPLTSCIAQAIRDKRVGDHKFFTTMAFILESADIQDGHDELLSAIEVSWYNAPPDWKMRVEMVKRNIRHQKELHAKKSTPAVGTETPVVKIDYVHEEGR